MRRDFLLYSFAILSISTVAPAQIAELQSLPALRDRKVTLKQSHIQLPEFLKIVAKQTGVTLDSSSSLKDLKVSIYVSEMTGAKLLDAVGDAVGAEWSVRDGVARLTPTTDYGSVAKTYLDREDEYLRKDVTERLRIMALVAATDDVSLQTYLDNLNQKINLEGKKQSPNQKLLGQMRDEYARIGMSRTDDSRAIGTTVSRFRAADWTTFWEGDAVQSRQNGGRGNPQPTQQSAVFLAYNPLSGSISSFSQNGSSSSGSSLLPTSLRRPPLELEKLKFAKLVADWNTTTIEGQAGEGPSLSRGTIGDIAASFNASGEIPVVALDSRYMISLNVSSGPISTVIANLRASGTSAKVRDGMLLLRPPMFWRLRRLEAGEDALKELSKTPVTVLSAATFFAKLTPLQQRAFASSDWDWGIQSGLFTPLATPVLRMLSTLDKKVLELTVTGSAIYASRLNAVQTAAFDQLVLASPFAGAATQSVFNLANIVSNPRMARSLIATMAGAGNTTSLQVGAGNEQITYQLNAPPK